MKKRGKEEEVENNEREELVVSWVDVQIVGDAVNNRRDVLVLLRDVLVNNHRDVLVLLPVDVLVVNNRRDVLVVVFSFRPFSLTLFHVVVLLCFHSFFIFLFDFFSSFFAFHFFQFHFFNSNF